ncbi:hypothetical protein M1L60_44155 [Actinoplanes sp. TRM 88003]|uniref:Uncharacterized protein n=1 Tax=Paractinoplanes aksuensis TaxID=2939490 RepID=A0ABT1E3A3_9ACTN|nr:hypothetical protein [Actinoplanes aksuensis]MCO8277594.1 hypothetical protein [Actinoplanes aksuensis]
MTVSGVERSLRTADPSPVPPIGSSTPLPPPIQGAERRSEGRARRTGVRWGLRVLAVGGLAGAAWLLTGSAAQAADRADGPDGSLLGSLVGADATSPVSGLLQAAVQPLESIEPAHHEQHLVADILDVPQQVLTRPDTDDDIDHEPFATIVDVVPDVDEVADEVAAPLRPTGGEAAPDQRLTPVTEPVTEVVLPADQEEPQPAPVPQEAEHTAETSRAQPAPVSGVRAVVPGKHSKTSSAPSAHRHHHHTAHAVSARPATEPGDDTPGGDTPAAPLRLHLGEVSGTPASGSGTPTEGGSAAFLPAAIANSTVARHVPAIAPDVEARRYDAEAPTVSPD